MAAGPATDLAATPSINYPILKGYASGAVRQIDGTRFAPFCTTAQDRSERDGASHMAATRTRPFSILITDDDRGCRESLRDIVEPEGYRTLPGVLRRRGARHRPRGAGPPGPVRHAHADADRPGDAGAGAPDQRRAAVHPGDGRRHRGADAAGASGAGLQRHSQAGEQERGAVHRGPGLAEGVRGTGRAAISAAADGRPGDRGISDPSIGGGSPSQAEGAPAA